MVRRNLKLHILMGLPGSGKTTFAEEYQFGNKRVKVWSLDKYRIGTEYNVIDALRRASQCELGTDTIMLDGLFLKNTDVIEATKMLAKIYDTRGIDLVIHYWVENRKACLKNDGGRRDVPSTRTIETAVFEAIDDKQILDELRGLNASIHIEEHTIQVKPDWYRYFKPHTYVCTDGKLKSMKWCTGGTIGNYNGDTHSIEGDEPYEFVELDELLEKIKPSLTFLQYKKILRECVTTETSYESDYYSGRTYYCNWVCDLRKLYDLLSKM